MENGINYHYHSWSPYRMPVTGLSGLEMATGKIRADINFLNPYPHAKIRACARNPQWVGNDTCTRYSRIPAYLRARLDTRKF